MTTRDIVNEVVKIILKHAKPSRIYLYGSHANGDANRASDIDIAYDDANFKDDHLIRSSLDNLQTLVKIDVKNMAFAEERFKTRVKATGRVLYSASRKLRAEDGLYNFSKAYEKFAEAADRKEELYSEGYADIYLDLMVKRFEFTYEMSWKAIKRYLGSIGIDALSPKACFQEAYAQGLIKDEGVWLSMIESRNLSSHTYDENEIREILDRMGGYRDAFRELKEQLEKHLA